MKIELLESLYDFKYKILVKEYLSYNIVKHINSRECTHTGYQIGSKLCENCPNNIIGEIGIQDGKEIYFFCKQKLSLKLRYTIQYLNYFPNSYTFEEIELLSKYA